MESARSRKLLRVAGTSFVLSLLLAPEQATSQATDIKVKKPNALLLLDNSGSMKLALDGNDDYEYKKGAGQKARWTILAETLTGSLNGLYVKDSGPYVSSNGCGPYANLDTKVLESLYAMGQTGGNSGSAIGPFTWPQANGNPKDKDAVAFCKTNDSDCAKVNKWSSADLCRQLAPGDADNGKDFSQVADGLLDSYRDKIRFGVASFDTMDNIPDDGGGKHIVSALRGRALGASNDPTLCVPAATGTDCWGLFACQNAIDGSQCLLRKEWRDDGKNDYVPSSPQWSYWHSADAVDTWLNGGRASYNVLDVRAQNKYSVSEQYVDIGMRNSRAFPWRGRLIGFGPPDWDLTADDLDKYISCTDEDSCTASHNEMVQQSILGLSRHLEANTPLAAMMRDAYEFIVHDTTTQGVHLPHGYSADVTQFSTIFGEIGPQNDKYFTAAAACRNTSVILVTDGEPFEDLDENMSHYAELLKDEQVDTYVIGVGLDSATWNPLGSSDEADNVKVDCSTLTAADLGAGKMCERDTVGGRRWKFADVAPWKDSPNTTKGGIRACCNLVETAVLGGTGRAYFPKNQSDLKQKLNTIFGAISGGASSRTVPVFGGVTASFVQGGGSTNAPAVSYEFRSSMDVSADDTLWRGNLERIRYACDANDAPVLQELDVDRGDVFASNLNATSVRRREFFTAVAQSADEMEGTLRFADVNTKDKLFGGGNLGAFGRLGGGEFEDNDVPAQLVDAQTSIDGAVASGTNNLPDLFGLSSSDDTTCKEELGASSLGECGTRLLNWYGGHSDPDGSGAVATDPAPSRDPNSAQCEGECSPLGAIYRTVPVFIPPPSVSENDDQNFSKRRTGATPSFFQDYKGRPTMLYSQTIDGQLHAFVVAKNEFKSGARFFDVPEADELENNELWTFIPPAVMPRLWDNFNSHARLLDGQLAWSNVVYERELGLDSNANAEAATTWKYDTVLVGCSGVSVGGSFCYAVEVTDPTSPRFLWQLRSAGNETGKIGAALFGDYVPGATITHMRIKDGLTESVKAVAIIPGGSMKTAPSDVTNRRSKDDLPNLWATSATRDPREKIRDWGKEVPARSLTFVELSTGRILARMVGEMGDNPRLSTQTDSETLLDDSVVVPPTNTKFDSPMTGIPAVFPSGGRVAERVFVGDADGTMWRVELNGGDPKKWEAHIAFDGYNVGSSGEATLMDAWVPAGDGKGAVLGEIISDQDKAATVGQPIQAAPLLSTDAAGNVVVTFATGDQESFNSLTPGMINLLVTFRDTFDASKDDDDEKETAYQAIVDAGAGVELAWRDGGRVTGPLNLFDGQLYFAYFTPAESLACTYGTGGICGLDYLAKNANKSPVSLNPVNGTNACNDFKDGEVVFGISVNLVPTCEITETDFSDPWMSGNYKAMTQANAGRYELVFQTGQGGATPTGDEKTRRSKIQLPQPKSRTNVRSFVRVAETEL